MGTMLASYQRNIKAVDFFVTEFLTKVIVTQWEMKIGVD